MYDRFDLREIQVGIDVAFAGVEFKEGTKNDPRALRKQTKAENDDWLMRFRKSARSERDDYSILTRNYAPRLAPRLAPLVAGWWVYSDEDGVIVSETELDLE